MSKYFRMPNIFGAFWDDYYSDAHVYSFFTHLKLSKSQDSPLPSASDLKELALNNPGAALGILRNPDLIKILVIDFPNIFIDILLNFADKFADKEKTPKLPRNSLEEIINLCREPINKTIQCVSLPEDEDSLDKTTLKVNIDRLLDRPLIVEKLDLPVRSLAYMYGYSKKNIDEPDADLAKIEKEPKSIAKYITEQSKVSDIIATVIVNKASLWKQVAPQYRYSLKTFFYEKFGWFKASIAKAKQDLINKNPIFAQKLNGEPVKPIVNSIQEQEEVPLIVEGEEASSAKNNEIVNTSSSPPSSHEYIKSMLTPSPFSSASGNASSPGPSSPYADQESEGSPVQRLPVDTPSPPASSKSSAQRVLNFDESPTLTRK